MANFAKDQYKRENEELDRLQEEKQVRDKRAKEKSSTIRTNLETERKIKIEELEEQHATPDEVFENIGIKKNETNK